MGEGEGFTPEGSSQQVVLGDGRYRFTGEFTTDPDHPDQPPSFPGIITPANGESFTGLVQDLGGSRYKVTNYEGFDVETGELPADEFGPDGASEVAVPVATEAGPAAVEQEELVEVPTEVSVDGSDAMLEAAALAVQVEAPVTAGSEAVPAEVSVAPSTGEAPAQPASLVESAQQVASEMKLRVATKELFDYKAAGKLLTAVEVEQMEGQNRTLIEARLQELRLAAAELLAEINSKVAVRDLQEKQRSGQLLTAVEIATIKTADPVGDEEYAELKRLEQQLQESSALVPEKPKPETEGVGSLPPAPEDQIAQIRRKQAEGKLLTRWELAQLRLADEAVTPAAPAVAAPAEPEPVEAEAEPALVAEPEVAPVELEMPVVEPPTPEEPGQLDELMGDAVATEMPPAPGLGDSEGVPASQVVIDVPPPQGLAPSGDGRAEPEAAPAEPEAVTPDEALGVAIEAFGESVSNPDGSKSSREQKLAALAAAEGVLAAAARLGQTGPEASQRAQRALAPLIGAAPQWFGLAGRRLLAREVTDEQGHYLSEAELKNRQDTGFLEALLELLLTLGDKTIDAVVAEVKNKTEGK